MAERISEDMTRALFRQPPARGVPSENPDSVTEYRHALEYACERGNLGRAKALVQRWRSEGEIYSPTIDDFSWALSAAASGGKVTTMSYLFEQGARMNRATAQCGVESGSLEVMQELLERGWDINAKDQRGSPMLRYERKLLGSMEIFPKGLNNLTCQARRNGAGLGQVVHRQWFRR